MPSQTQDQHIPGVAVPQPRDTVAGVHPDAFRRPEERLQDQQLNPSILDPNTGLTAAQTGAQGQFWQQEQHHAEQTVSDGDVVAERELMEDTAAARQDAAQPLR